MSFLYSIGHCLPCQIISHRKAAILPPFQMGQKHFMLSLCTASAGRFRSRAISAASFEPFCPCVVPPPPLQQSQMAIAVRRNSHHQSIPAADRPDADFFRYIRDSIPLPQRIHPHSTSSSMTNRSFQTTITPCSFVRSDLILRSSRYCGKLLVQSDHSSGKAWQTFQAFERTGPRQF